ncbi:antitoxin Xre/MbcA/ParS toxin-binding domain-containing protein [Pseudomonas atacamensis]|uniref:antitoxin Xre/MbcA/ParS toxin-binding domain-containing protein n=1 Tax=Pseudomonas atacamensis TaxID=2565368 RepID=UPI0035A23A02
MNNPQILALCPSSPLGCWSITHRCLEKRCEHILHLATRVLGSRALAGQWLCKPAIGLRYQVPCNILITRSGYQQVVTLLGRIEYGVYV